MLVAADYSQLELRVIAHLSRDARLIAVLNGAGDVFRTMAAQWRDVDVLDVTSEQRRQIKQVNHPVRPAPDPGIFTSHMYVLSPLCCRSVTG